MARPSVDGMRPVAGLIASPFMQKPGPDVGLMHTAVRWSNRYFDNSTKVAPISGAGPRYLEPSAAARLEPCLPGQGERGRCTGLARPMVAPGRAQGVEK